MSSLTTLDLASAYRFLVRITPVAAEDRNIPGLRDYWRTAELPELSAESREEYDGGDPRPSIIIGRETLGDVVVTRGYSPRRDADLIRRLNTRIGSHWTISVQDTDADDTPIGRPTNYRGVLRAVSRPNTDRNGNDTAMVGLTFHAYSVA